MADSIAPGVAIAQAIGRFGNWFNQELFGKPTTLPWGLEIDPDNPDAVVGAEAYHPTFAYEALWNVGVAGVVVWADRRWRLGHGRAFALYLALYAVGRSWIEALRIDDAATFGGLRLNDYTAAVVFVGAVVYLVLRRRAGREDVVQTGADEPEEHEADVTSDA
jgi:prolipoprotein diacylglyceryl transferase